MSRGREYMFFLAKKYASYSRSYAMAKIWGEYTSDATMQDIRDALDSVYGVSK